MSISQEKLDAFQARMNAWVASQGLMFQLSHSGKVHGAQSRVHALALKLLIRLAVLALIVGGVFWIYLSKRTDFGSFQTGIQTGLAEGLGAEVSGMGIVKRRQGFLSIGEVKLEGGEKSFFDRAHLAGLKTRMGMLDGVLTAWDGETVLMDSLKIQLRAGAEDDEVGSAILGRLLAEEGNFKFSKIDIKDAEIGWGYSPVTRGSIRGAKVLATRVTNGWNVLVSGGVFSQNWLRRMEIELLSVTIRPEGVRFEEARLRKGDGEMSFTASIAGRASNPRLEGSGTVRALPLEPFLAPEVRAYLGGRLSGSFKLSGTPYGQDGVLMDAAIELEEGDRIELRDRFPLFRAISVVDRFRSYKNVRFTVGRFRMETGGERAKFSKVWLHAKEVMRLEGDFLARPPTEKEIAESLNVEERGEMGGTVLREDPEENIDDELRLEQAAGTDEEEREGSGERYPSETPGGTVSRLIDEARLRQERAPMLKGKVRLGLNDKAFLRTTALSDRFPVDPETDLRWVELPLEGNIYTIGVELAKKIYTMSRAEQ